MPWGVKTTKKHANEPENIKKKHALRPENQKKISKQIHLRRCLAHDFGFMCEVGGEKQ